MTDDNNPTVSQLLNLLNDWRHLPFYSMETRAAPFFAMFMREVLKTRFGTEMHEILIPEFPLRIGTLYDEEERKQLWPEGGPSSDQSYNVDYVAFAKGKDTAYLVELKTDMDSLRSQQDEYLCAARKKGLPSLVEGVRKMAKKSEKKQKYVHLLHRLSAPGIELVSIPDDTPLYENTFPRVVRGWTQAIDRLTFEKQHFSETTVVFVQPVKGDPDENGFEHIYFEEVANIVERRGDLGALFANYLRQWTVTAGSRNPRDIPPPS